MTLAALDIETKCNQGCTGKCDHALDPHRSDITLIGVYFEYRQGEVEKYAYRTITGFTKFLEDYPYIKFVAHNGKFDFKHLAVKGLDISHKWMHDTQLLASVMTEKIPSSWLEEYEAKRVEKNKEVPHGYSHRSASHHSLKTLAPYFLGVEPFWEDPTNHDDVEYCLKDCEYTYKLYKKLLMISEPEEYQFYETKMMPWAKMLMRSELRGIKIDLELLDRETAKAALKTATLENELKHIWARPLAQYHKEQRHELRAKYNKKMYDALVKSKDHERTRIRYDKLYQKAKQKLKPLNLDSPSQLAWLLRDVLQYDITDFQGKESTGKEVLERLAKEGKEDVKKFLEYRKQQKLCTAFFPSYFELQVNGNIHCSFNPTGTRTGRLSSSRPNLQQVPGGLHSLYISRPGRKLVTYDYSAIEPRVIAYLTECPVLYDIFNKGINFHDYVTKKLFNLDCKLEDVKKEHPKLRAFAKEFDLSVFYGAGANRIQQSAMKHGIAFSINECRDMHKWFKEEFSAVFECKKDIDNQLKTHPILNILGRPVFIQDKDDIYMKGFNTLVQSSASDLLLESAHRLEQHFMLTGMPAYPVLYVHDELVFEVPAQYSDMCAELQEKTMCNYELTTCHGSVKLEVEGQISDRWTK